jgi:uncharacterized membrane protein YgcG
MTAIRRLCLGLAFLTLAANPAAAVERILNFISDVTVERNSDLLVTETIRVVSERRVIRHGIFRDFPTIYTRPDGIRVVVGFDVISVMRDGAAEHFTTEGISNGVRVRIGQADRLVANGEHEYVIRYRSTRQIGFFRDYDELYWNATGNGWPFTIEQAEARINLPAQVPFKQTAFYTGPQGARGKDAMIVERRPGRIVFRTTRPLPPRNGLTVAAAWEKGLIVEPTSAQQATYWLKDNLGLAVAFVGLALILTYYFFAWRRVGRDPRGGTIIPLFGPPQDMSPAAVRYVDRMAFDDRCFAAAIIDLGVKGHLKIAGTGKTTTLHKRAGGRAATTEEHAMETALFASGPSMLLDQVNHRELGEAKDALKETLAAAFVGKLFANNYGWSSLGLILTLLVLVATVLAVGSTHNYDSLAGLIIALIAAPFVMGGAGMMASGWLRSFGGTWPLIGGLTILVIAVAIGLIVIWFNAPTPANLLVGCLVYAAAAVAGSAFPLLKAPTVAGRKRMDDIEGFRQYLGVAEEDRLNALNPPEKTPELFERFLPYAIALDVQNAWAKRFAAVLAAAGATAAASTWYEGNYNWRDDPVSFADHLSGELSQTISSASTAPGSSGGSGGGGSSGGGGGGGGGGGW